MTCTVAVVNGVGVQHGPVYAFDRVARVNVSGLAAGTNGASLSARLTTPDGQTLLAAIATATQSSGAAALVFDLDTAAMLGMFSNGAQTTQAARLRIVLTVTRGVVADAPIIITPGVRP
jgi:hypothetical protein